MINYGFEYSIENGVQRKGLNVEIVLGEGGIARYTQPEYGKIKFFGLKKRGVVLDKVVNAEGDGNVVSIKFKDIEDLDYLISDLFKVRDLMVE